MTCPIDYKECRSSGCFFHGGVNKICCIKIEQPIFNNGGQIPAYGNEKTAAQVISELKLENERLKEALKNENGKLIEYLVSRINRLEQERRECTPGSDAYMILLGHKYEAQRILSSIETAKKLTSK